MPRKAVRGKGHGGARPGAGRKRKLVDVVDPGVADRKTRQEVMHFRDRYDLMPLDYCMRIVNGLDTRTGEPLSKEEYRKQQQRRDDMAKHACSFLHSKLSSIEVSGQGGGPIKHSVDIYKLSDEELALFEQLLSKSMVTIDDSEDAPTLDLKALPGPDTDPTHTTG